MEALADLYCFTQSPMQVFLQAEEALLEDLAVFSSKTHKEVQQNGRLVGTHAFHLLVHRFDRDPLDAQAFIDAIAKQADACEKGQQPARFVRAALGGPLFRAVTARSVAHLLSMLTSETMRDMLKEEHAFFTKKLPEPIRSVSSSLGLPAERVLRGTLKSDAFTRSRLLRCFGDTFMPVDKPHHFDGLLIRVSSGLFDAFCTHSGMLKDKALAFSNVYVHGDAAQVDEQGRFDLKHRDGVEYFVQVSLNEFLAAMHHVLAKVAQISGKNDDVI